MEGLIMAGQLILGLSILVGLHEAGHMIAARMFGMRVEKYFIGFPPKLFSFKKGDTEYGLGALPLGGFVKISGMVDESLDTEGLSAEPQDYEFRSKPAWQRLIVMLGGIIVNVITGVFIFIVMVMVIGERYLPAKEIKHGIVARKLGKEIGLQTGDKILKINGKEFERFTDILSSDVLLGSGSYYTVERNGELIEIPIPNNFIETLTDNKGDGFVEPAYPFKVGQIVPGSGAAKAKIKKDDLILAINDTKISFFHELQEKLSEEKNNEIAIKILRSNDTLMLNAKVSEDGKLGFGIVQLLKDSTNKYGFSQSVALGTKQAFSVVFDNIKGLGKIFKGEVSASKAVSGPIGIAQVFGGNWDWVNFWRITGLLSMVLAFMNFLPIPALDGGHVMFLTYEIVTGKKPSDKFLEIAQKFGMILLLSLMIFAVFNDFIKLLF
jgi:regulator of sigma E protease